MLEVVKWYAGKGMPLLVDMYVKKEVMRMGGGQGRPLEPAEASRIPSWLRDIKSKPEHISGAICGAAHSGGLVNPIKK
jgi:hypothetical protein